MKTTSWIFLTVSLLSMPFACGSGQTETEKPSVISDEFTDYWFSGTAEVSAYKLTQARYGELREGESVLVFVSEPFSRSKGVKLDDPVAAGNDKMDVLKLNFTKKFVTGIYDYSTLFSVFTPVSTDRYNASLKLTSTCQEWCGHTFTQLNLDGSDYKFSQFSYFESEGDQTGKLKNTLLEDELWTMIRISPASIPLGKVTLLPSVQYLRFSHEETVPREAEISMKTVGELKVLTVTYPYNQRSLAITFTAGFPYMIESWEETYKDGWGDQATILKTTGVLTGRLNSAYWTRNSNEYRYLRRELGLEGG